MVANRHLLWNIGVSPAWARLYLVRWRKQAWVLKKSLNVRPFSSASMRRRFCLVRLSGSLQNGVVG